MQDDHVERVHQVLIVLQPVAGDDLRPATANAVVVRFKELACFELFQKSG